MSDDFFDDEQELMDAAEAEAEAPALRPAAAKAKAAKEAAETGKAAEEAAADGPAAGAPVSKPVRKAPPFWMVLAIAFIALVLGVVIGYLFGTSATLAELGNSSASTAQQATSGTESTTGQLPEGHPNLNISDDGTATLADSGSSEE